MLTEIYSLLLPQHTVPIICLLCQYSTYSSGDSFLNRLWFRSVILVYADKQWTYVLRGTWQTLTCCQDFLWRNPLSGLELSLSPFVCQWSVYLNSHSLQHHGKSVLVNRTCLLCTPLNYPQMYLVNNIWTPVRDSWEQWKDLLLVGGSIMGFGVDWAKWYSYSYPCSDDMIITKLLRKIQRLSFWKVY